MADKDGGEEGRVMQVKIRELGRVPLRHEEQKEKKVKIRKW